MIALTHATEALPIRGSFAISRGSRTETPVVTVRIDAGEHRGHGECTPYARYGESVESVRAQIEGMRQAIEEGIDRTVLLTEMAAGAARNALDCALWDLEAKRAGRRAWEIAGIEMPATIATAYTLSLDTAEKMAEAARAVADRPLLKIKLAGEGDMARVAAIREAAPKVRLIVDANEGWTPDMVEPYGKALAGLGVDLIEQPLPAADDAMLAEVKHYVPFAADESAHDRATLDHVVGRYDVINIKLDKTGGLTEALALAQAAREAGLEIMVGCMLASSLSMAPAMLVAASARFVDLDGPLLLASDRDPGIAYDGSLMSPPPAGLWG